MAQKVRFSKYSRANVAFVMAMDPLVRELFLEFLWRIAASGEYVRITSSMRTAAQQLDEYRKGRPWEPGYDPKRHKNGPVTDVKCPYSFHCHGLAIDIVPLDRIGNIEFRAVYNSKKRFEQIARIAGELGITWGYAAWGVDQPHFHYDGGLGIERVAAGAVIPTPSFKPIERSEVMQRAIDRLLS